MAKKKGGAQSGPDIAVEPEEQVQPQHYVNPRTPTEAVVQHRDPDLVDRTLVSAERTKNIYKLFREEHISGLPDTTYWAATVKNDPVVSKIATQVFDFFAHYYGNDNLAPFIMSEVFDEQVADNTLATMKYLRGYTPPPTSGGFGAPSPTGAFGAAGGADPQETVQRILANPAEAKNLSPAEIVQAKSTIDELLASIELLPEDAKFIGDVRRAIYIGATGNVRMALSEQDIQTLQTIKGIYDGMKIGGTTQEATPELKKLGVDQIRYLGNGVIVLNKGEADSDPIQAYAIKVALEQAYPDMEIQYGREGAMGWIMNKLGTGVDFLSAPFGAALNQASEFGEGIGITQKDRDRYLAAADGMEKFLHGEDLTAEEQDALNGQVKLQAGMGDGFFVKMQDWLKTGNVPEDYADDAMRAILRWRDNGTEELGWNEFTEQMQRNTAPKAIGTGFGESFMDAVDLYPGDPAYGPAFAAASLFGSVVFDPLFVWGPAVLGGARAAKLIPKFHAAEGALYPEVGVGLIKNGIFRTMARYPERLMETKQANKVIDVMWGVKQADEEQFYSGLVRFFGDSREVGGGTQVAKDLAGATSRADMKAVLSRHMFGLDQEVLDVTRYTQELADKKAALKALDEGTELVGDRARGAAVLGASKTELKERIYWLEDVIKGRPVQRPLRQLLSSRQLRQLKRAAGVTDGPIEKTYAFLIEHAENFPANFLDTLPRENEELMHYGRLGHFYQDSGGGKLIALPHVARRAKTLRLPTGEIIDNIVEDSFNHLANIGKTLGISDKRINNIMAGWRDLERGGAADGYAFLKKTWETFVDESPIVPAINKADLKQMWHSTTSDRAPGWLAVKIDETGAMAPISTLKNKLTDSPMPAFSADMLTVWKTPSVGELRSYLTMAQRNLKQWETAGRMKKMWAGTYESLSRGWSAVNNFWRSATLGFRLFGALPARIAGEQMLRMAGYDYASLVHHPIEWFKSTHWGANPAARLGGSEYELFLEHPGAALGVMVQNLEASPYARFGGLGRNTVELSDGAAYWHAYSERIGKLHASPEVNEWLLPYLDDPEAAVEYMKTSEAGQEMLALYKRTNNDPVEAVRATMEELKGIIGEGPGSEDIISLLKNGVASIGRTAQPEFAQSGRFVRRGTADLADALEELSKSGRWTPGAFYLNPSASVYLPAMRGQGSIGNFVNHMFEWMYTNPDLALSRGPLYRQMALREYKNLVARGYAPTTAKRLAHAYAARGTADLMFTIGAKTSGEWFLKNINPFFPAYRELATTWLKRIPLRIGEGHWALGAAALSRRADVWYNFFKDLGVVQEDQNGQPRISLPFMAPLVRALTGTQAEYNITAPVSSLAGILPIPLNLFQRDENGDFVPWSDRIKGLAPTLGGPAASLLHMFNSLPGLRGGLDLAEDFLTLTGADASLGPIAVDRMFEAFGIEGPWMSGSTSDFHESMQAWSVIDGMRIAKAEMGPPPEDQNSPEFKAYVEELISRGNRYSTWMYAIKAVSSMALPVSLTITDEAKQEASAMWALINALPLDEDGQSTSAIIRANLADKPYLEAYMTGKNLDTRTVEDPEETLRDYMDAVKRGEIKARTPMDWAIYNLGLQSIQQYRDQINGTFDPNLSIAEQVLDPRAREKRRELYRDIDLFLAHSQENVLEELGQTQSFEDMYNIANQYRDKREGTLTPRLSREQEIINQISELEDEISKYFSPDPEHIEDYYKAKDKLFGLLDYEPTSDFGKAQKWYFDTYAGPYYDKLNKLYNKAARLTKADKEAGPVYDAIRHLKNDYNKVVTNQWGDWISPEAYSFSRLTPENQRRSIADWADTPAEWLSNFQLEQVYGLDDEQVKAAAALSDIKAKGDRALEKYQNQWNLDDSSQAMEDAEALFDKFYAQKAEDKGIGDYWKVATGSLASKLGAALNLNAKTPIWEQAEKAAAAVTGAVEKIHYTSTQTYSITGDSAPALKARNWLGDKIARWRNADAEFDRIMGELQVALGEDGKPLSDQEVVDKVFFGKTLITFK